MNIQWYPGHMTKTRRMMEEDIRQVDAVCEILDARIPVSSRNPDLDRIAEGKPRLVILNRIDLADAAATQAWARYFKARGCAVIEINAKSGQGVARFVPELRALLAEKIAYYEARGMSGRLLKVMICGIPNVGKSTLINRVAGRNAAKAEDRPGVTRGKQWIRVDSGIDMMDTPGILWPKFEDKRTGLYLAFTGAVKDDILDIETLGAFLMETLTDRYPEALSARYHFEPDPALCGYTLLEEAAKRRGFRISGGEFDLARMARVLLREFRDGTLGRMSLELPEDADRLPLETLTLRGFDGGGMLTEDL